MTPTGQKPGRKRWTDDWLFLRKFFQQGHSIAAMSPSSRWLGRKCIKYVDFRRPQVIVELGAGTGPVTAEIARRLGADSTLIAVEIDPEFCSRLRARFPHPNIEVVQTDAAQVADCLRERGIDQVDSIISGLPIFYFDRADQVAVLKLAHDFLVPDGHFVQLTHTLFVRDKFYQELFEDVRFEPVLLNMPPGGAFFCQRVRPEAIEA